jgi:transcriptional regulator with XRE-family HTH domain
MKALGQNKLTAVACILAEARRAAGISQREAARRMGRTQNWVSNIERGHRYCRFSDFIDLAASINADPRVLCERYLDLLAARKSIARVLRVRAA